jgi:hypothetical protein
LKYYEAHGGTPRDGILLRRMLMVMCSVYDWSNARVGDAQIAQLRSDCGAVYWDDTDPAQPPLARILQCIQRAQQAHEQKSESERGFAPLEAMAELVAVVMGLSGAYLHSHDVARLRPLPAVIAPLRPLAPMVDVFCDIAQQAIERACGVEIGDRSLALAYRLGEAAALPEIVRVGGSVIQLHLHVVEDARRGRQRALEQMDLLASLIGNDMFFVLHGRWLGHAFRGHASLAEGFRKRADVITEDDLWRRKAVLFIEAQLHALTGELPALQRVTAAIAELADTFPGWRPWLAYCRAEVHRLRGELDASNAQLEAALAAAQPGEHRAWVLAAPAYAELQLARGDADGALREAESILASVQALSLDRSAAVAAERVRALALSNRLDHPAARASLARAFELAHELGYEGLPLARLYEAQARIAIAAQEREQCAQALKLLWQLLEHADAPALIHAYEALREESSDKLALVDVPAATPISRETATESTEMFTQIRTRMNAFDDRDERAQHALELLMHDSGARSGHLFLFDAGGAFAAASLGRSPPNEALLVSVQQYLEAELHETKTAVVTMADVAGAETAAATVLSAGDVRFAPVLLSDNDGGDSQLAGLALLAMPDKGLQAPRSELVRAISRCLLASGDSVAVAGEA